MIFIVSIVFICLEQKPNLNHIKKYVKIMNFVMLYNVVMSSEDAKVLNFNEYRRYDKEPVIIYADVESLMGKIKTCKIILKNYLR